MYYSGNMFRLAIESSSGPYIKIQILNFYSKCVMGSQTPTGFVLIYIMVPSSSSIGTTTLDGFRPAQLSLSILSRKVLDSAVASGTSNPQLWRRTRDLERSNFRHKRTAASEATLANPAEEGGTMGEKWPRNFAESGDFHVTLGSFTCR
jgi:hypothetical protein